MCSEVVGSRKMIGGFDKSRRLMGFELVDTVGVPASQEIIDGIFIPLSEGKSLAGRGTRSALSFTRIVYKHLRQRNFLRWDREVLHRVPTRASFLWPVIRTA